MLTLTYLCLVIYSFTMKLVDVRITGSLVTDICRVASVFALALTWPTLLLSQTILRIPTVVETISAYYQPALELDAAEVSSINQLSTILNQ